MKRRINDFNETSNFYLSFFVCAIFIVLRMSHQNINHFNKTIDIVSNELNVHRFLPNWFNLFGIGISQRHTNTMKICWKSNFNQFRWEWFSKIDSLTISHSLQLWHEMWYFPFHLLCWTLLMLAKIDNTDSKQMASDVRYMDCTKRRKDCELCAISLIRFPLDLDFNHFFNKSFVLFEICASFASWAIGLVKF